MTGYLVTLACDHCGGVCHHVNGATASTEAKAVCRCEDCGRQWLIFVRMLPVGAEEHGTEAGYNRHKRNGEEACASCKAQHAMEYSYRRELVSA